MNDFQPFQPVHITSSGIEIWKHADGRVLLGVPNECEFDFNTIRLTETQWRELLTFACTEAGMEPYAHSEEAPRQNSMPRRAGIPAS